MKSYANLWPRITSFENLYEAFRQARRSKRSRPDVAAFEFDLESNLLALQRELTETWLEIYNTERPHDSLGRVPPLTFLPRPDAPVESTFEVST